jgi:ATPase subunit of ABC transporter with duplicated ATPase domains
MIPYLQVENLTKSFGDLVLFHEISFGIAQGQRIGLIAKNGSGKTTFAQALIEVHHKEHKIIKTIESPRETNNETNDIDGCAGSLRALCDVPEALKGIIAI